MKNNNQEYDNFYSYSRASGRYDKVDFDWSTGEVKLLPWSDDCVLNCERLEDIHYEMVHQSWNTLAGYGKPVEAPVEFLSEGAWITPKALSLSERDEDYS